MSYLPTDSEFNKPEGWPDCNEGSSQGEKYDTVCGITNDFHIQADYGANWSSFTSANLPQSPTDGKTCSRTNTNATGGSMRTWKWDDYSSVWRYFDWNDGSVGTL